MFRSPDIEIAQVAEVYTFDSTGAGGSIRAYRVPVTNEGDRAAENCRVSFEMECTYYPFHPSEENQMEIHGSNQLSWADSDHPTSIDINPGDSIEFDFLQLREGETGWHLAFASPEGWESIAPLQINTENEEGNFTRNGEAVELDDHTGFVEQDQISGETIHHNPMPHENLFKSQTDWSTRTITLTGGNIDPIQKRFVFDWNGELSVFLE